MDKFDEGLKKRIRKGYEEDFKEELERVIYLMSEKKDTSTDTQQILGNAKEEIKSYFYNKSEMESKSDDEIYELLEEFNEHFFSDERLKEVYEEKELTEEELKYIKYCYLSNHYRDMKYVTDGTRYAITEIAIKRLLLREFGEEGIQEIRENIENYLKNTNSRSVPDYERLLTIISDDPYNRQSLEQNIATEMEKNVDREYNMQINCGGYALRIDRCVFPEYCYSGGKKSDLDKSVSFVLANFPYVELLGDRKIKDDEYMVIYRVSKDGEGHHFIRVDDDGVVREKDARFTPRIFEGWSKNEFGEEQFGEGMAVFAVKKDHEMYGHVKDCLHDKKGLNFEETVNLAIKNESNNFDYHGHEFSLKKSSDEEVYVVSNGEIVGYVLTGDEECLVEIEDGKEEYVQNFTGPIKPDIGENGLLNNWSQFYDREPVKSEDSERLKALDSKELEL